MSMVTDTRGEQNHTIPFSSLQKAFISNFTWNCFSLYTATLQNVCSKNLGHASFKRAWVPVHVRLLKAQ